MQFDMWSGGNGHWVFEAGRRFGAIGDISLREKEAVCFLCGPRCMNLRLRIQVRHRHESVYTDTNVSLLGIGIVPTSRGQLFRQFRQYERRASGTGLGLFTLSKRVESIGGCCGVESQFWFLILYNQDSSVSLSSNICTAVR